MDNENNTNLNEEWVTVEYEADLDEQKEKLGRKKISPKNFKYIIAIILCILAITLFYGTYLLVANNKVVKAYENKVYPGIYLLDKEVGGLTEGELKETIKSMVNDIRDREIKVTIEDNEFKTNYWNIDVVALTDDIEKEIMAYGKDKGFFAKLKLIQKPAKKEYTFSLTCDEEKLSSFVNGIGDQVNMEPKNATIDITAGAVTVEAGKNGYELNVENLIKSIKEKISDVNNKNGVVLTAELTEVGPSITEDALKNVNGKISSFTTYFSAGPSGHNIQVAAEYVDNTIIMPGETFSCEQAIGPTTLERGFGYANTYVSGKVVPGLGGGVCQVATTVYNAELRAGILPTERQNHMMTVGYIGLGLDATLADNAIDLKFKNPYDYPIVINSYTSGGALVVEFWSEKNVTGGITYEPKSYQSGSLYAETYLYGYDENGELVSEQYVDSSTYKPFN